MVKRFWRRVQRVIYAFVADDAPQAAAAISFYAVTALSPLLVVLVSLAGALVPSEVFKSHLLRQTDTVFGDAVAKFIETVLSQSHSSSGWTAAVGFIFILVAGAALFAQIHASLNKVWNIAPYDEAGWKTLVTDRLIAMAVVLLTGGLLVSSLFVSAWLTWANEWISLHLQWNVNTVTLTQNGLTFLLLSAMCALLFRMLPDAMVAWRDIATGATLTAALFLVTKSVFAFYLAKFNVAANYGQAGTLVLLLLWVYFSSMVFLLGAEWTKVQAEARGRAIRSRRLSTIARILQASRRYPSSKWSSDYGKASEFGPSRARG